MPISAGMLNSARNSANTVGWSRVGTEPMPSARAASIRFCAAGNTDSGYEGGTDNAKITHGTDSISSASRIAARWRVLSGGTSSGPAQPSSSLRLAHQARRYSAPKARIRSASRTTRKRAIWLLPPFGAFDAASRMVSISAVAIGCDVNRRIARCVNIASPIGMLSRSAPIGQDQPNRAHVVDILQALQRSRKSVHGGGLEHARRVVAEFA